MKAIDKPKIKERISSDSKAPLNKKAKQDQRSLSLLIEEADKAIEKITGITGVESQEVKDIKEVLSAVSGLAEILKNQPK